MSRVLTQWRQSAPGRWLATRSRRERGMLAAAACVLLGVGAWTLLWLPLTASIGELRATARQSRAALAEARQMAQALPALARNARPPAAVPPRTAVERAVAAAFGAVPGLLIGSQDERTRVTLPAVPFAAVVTLVESLQRDAGLQLQEATLTARMEPGTVRAELVFGR
jgi:type II secretory pathway component PulM